MVFISKIDNRSYIELRSTTFSSCSWRVVEHFYHKRYGHGKIEGNIPRLDIEEATRMVGLDVKIDAIANLRGEITSLFLEDPILEHQEEMRLAKEHYATAPAKNMDVVIVNAYSKPNECAIAPFIGIPSLKGM
jgi:hypothetical protein